MESTPYLKYTVVFSYKGKIYLRFNYAPSPSDAAKFAVSTLEDVDIYDVDGLVVLSGHRQPLATVFSKGPL